MRKTCTSCKEEKDLKRFVNGRWRLKSGITKFYYSDTCRSCLGYDGKYNLRPSYIYSVILTNSRIRKNRCTVLMSREDFIDWYEDQEGVCHYCKRTLEEILNDSDPYNGRMKRFEIDRKDNGTGYEVGNLALCCRRCNSVKSDYFSEFEMLKIGEIVRKKHRPDS